MTRLFAFATLAAASVAPLALACGGGKFGFNGICITIGGDISVKGTPPTGKSCPSTWYWHTSNNCCTPTTPSYPQSPSCNNGHVWDSNSLCCKSPTPSPPTTPSTPPTDCKSGEFIWFGLGGKCCLPSGGQPNPPSPPPGTSCPKGGWWWHSGQGCCVPPKPNPPTPSCPGGLPWIGGSQCCKPPPPQPSGGYGWNWKRNHKKRSPGLCPIGLEACPIGGLLSLAPDYECVDTERELQSCGGCSSVYPKLDCTSIEGAWNVGCEQGSCRVYSCEAGYKLAHDHKSCIKL